MTEGKPKCDIDDLMCQLQVMNLLGGMKNLLGDEKFKARYPEFEGLDQTVEGRIKEQKITIQEAYEKCGLSEPEETIEPEIIEEE